MSIYMVPVIVPVEESPDYREWECRRCHAWCETIGPAVYCPKCGKDTLEELYDAPWSSRKKVVFWSCVTAALVAIYLLLAWFSVYLFASVYRWWPFNSIP